jgi:hypothetical protein
MKSTCIPGLVSMLAVFSLLCASPGWAAEITALTEQEAVEIATDAYIYGYSLMTTDVTKCQQSNVDKVELLAAPLGSFRNIKMYPPASFRGVSAANADTLYSMAWLDLSEPQVFSHPEIKGRFFTFELFDLWMIVPASVGTNTSGEKAMTYLFTRSDWKGEVPPGMTHIAFPTRYMGILGRTFAMDTPEDLDRVRQLQAEYKLMPLSAYGKSYTFTPRPVEKTSYSMTDSPQKVIAGLGLAGYFDRLCELMASTAPPSPEDAPMLQRMAKLGITPGEKLNLTALSPAIQKALEKVPDIALGKIVAKWESQGKVVNGWQVTLAGGSYGTDYLLRAAWAARAWPGQLPTISLYPFTYVDGDGNALTGKNRYTLTFPKGQMPPVHEDGFWSVTMYLADKDGLWFHANPLKRINIQYPRDARMLCYNPDGSLTLYLQNESPGKDKEPNWLPAPQGDFSLMLRLYWPTRGAPLSWMVPGIPRPSSG